MTIGQRVVRGLAGRVDLDDASRTALADDALRLAHERGRCGTAAEIASLAAVTLELRALRASGGRCRAFVRQGLWFGGVLTSIAALVALAPTVWRSFGPSTLTVSFQDAALVATAACALALGTRPPRRRASTVPLAIVAVAVFAVGAAALAGPSVAVAVLTIVVPAFLVVASVADPRLGVAAAVAFFWRFVATDPAGLAAIIAAVRAGESTFGALVRWSVMAAAFLVATVVTRRHLRLAATP